MELLVYFVDGTDTLDRAILHSKKINRDRMFILNSKQLQHNDKFTSKDKILIFKHDDFDINCSIKLSFLYSEPKYSKLIFIFNLDLDLENIYTNNENYIQNDDYLLISRNYLIFNEFNFKKPNKIILDPIVMFENIDKALKGEIVDELVFKEALKELLPIAEYSFDSNFDITSFEYKNLFDIKHTESKTKYLISNEKSANVNKNIVFTLADYENYKYVLRRIDGLNCYIF